KLTVHGTLSFLAAFSGGISEIPRIRYRDPTASNDQKQAGIVAGLGARGESPACLVSLSQSALPESLREGRRTAVQGGSNLLGAPASGENEFLRSPRLWGRADRDRDTRHAGLFLSHETMMTIRRKSNSPCRRARIS